MESRKYQLQKQIIEALKANDDNLYSLLKSQWAHRFGVESLEELKSLDLNELNQKNSNLDMVDNPKIDQSKENSFEGDKANSIKDNDNQEKEINNNELKLNTDDKHQAFNTKSYEIVDKENYVKNKNIAKENRIQQDIQALIPLPPKPKYGYLKKWLLKW